MKLKGYLLLYSQQFVFKPVKFVSLNQILMEAKFGDCSLLMQCLCFCFARSKNLEYERDDLRNQVEELCKMRTAAEEYVLPPPYV